LFEKGFRPVDLEDRGSSMIQSLLNGMSWYFDPYSFTREKKNIDTSNSREKIKMIHMLARSGARWEPKDRGYINDARRSLLKMQPDYVMEFIWIMSEYKACNREIVETLVKTPTMKPLLSKHTSRLNELLITLQ